MNKQELKKEALDELNKIPGVRAKETYVPRPDLESTLDEMKADVNERHSDAYQDKVDSWKHQMMTYLIDLQRKSGVAVPSAHEAEKKMNEIWQKINARGEVDFHLQDSVRSRKLVK